MADRIDYVLRHVEVTHVAKPYGSNRENPPHLWDLRRFVEACDGLPDTLVVDVKVGRTEARDSGRRDVTLSVTMKEPVTDEMVEERANLLQWFKRKAESTDPE